MKNNILFRPKSEFGILYRHFLNRLIKNELINDESKLFPKITLGISIVLTLTTFISIFCLQKYLFIPQLKGNSWVDISTLMLISSVTIGMVSIFEWNQIFLNKKDRENLLPIRILMKNLFFAKFSAVATLVLIVTFSSSIIPITFFPMVLSNTFSEFFYSFFINLTGFLLLNFFIFFLISTINIFFYFTLPAKLYRLISFMAQIFLIMTLIMVLVFPYSLNNTIFHLYKTGSLKILYIPHLWFIGIIQFLKGTNGLMFHKLAKIGFISFLLSFSFYFLFLAKSMLSYAKDNSNHISYIRLIKFKRFFTQLFFRHQIENAMYLFLKNSLFYVEHVRMSLTFFIATGFGIISIYYANSFLFRGVKSFDLINELPFITNTIFYFLILGIYTIFNRPLSLRNRWIIMLTELREKTDYISGIKKSVFFLLLLPTSIITILISAILTNFLFALNNIVINMTFSLILLEIYFHNFKKFPFCCSEIPISGKMVFFWVIKFLGFLIYIKIVILIESFLIQNMLYLILFVIFTLILILINRNIQKNKFDFLYEIAEPEVFQSLNLNKPN